MELDLTDTHRVVYENSSKCDYEWVNLLKKNALHVKIISTPARDESQKNSLIEWETFCAHSEVYM